MRPLKKYSPNKDIAEQNLKSKQKKRFIKNNFHPKKTPLKMN